MLVFLLPLLIVSKDAKYPKFVHIWVGPDSQDEVNYQKELRKNKKAFCKELEKEGHMSYDECIDYINAWNDDQYSPGPNINSAISNVDKTTEVLMIQGTNIGEVDLSNLKSQMLVYITSYGGSTKISKKCYKDYVVELYKKMKKVSFDGSPKSFIRLINSNENKHIKEKEITLINGGIKDKVAFLCLDSLNVRFTGSDLNIHSLYLKDSLIDEDSKKIKSNFLIISPDCYCDNSDVFSSANFIQVSQFSLINNDYYPRKYRIIYNQDSWSVNGGSDLNSPIKCYGSKISIPYKNAGVFNLMGYTNLVDIYLTEGVELDTYNGINITNYERIEIIKEYSRSLSEKEVFELTSTNWDSVDKDKCPKVTLIYDKSVFQLNDENFSPLKTSEENLFSYKPKNKKGLGPGAIAGIVIACVAVVAIIIVVVIIVIRKKKQAKDNSSKEGNGNDEE